MSDTTEDMEIGAALYEGYLERMELQISSRIWQTRTGELVKVDKMDDRWIGNCIRMLEKSNNPFAKDWIRVFKDELKDRKRGDK